MISEIAFYGGLLKRFTRTVLKTVVPKGTVGSNPTPSAIKIRIKCYLRWRNGIRGGL